LRTLTALEVTESINRNCAYWTAQGIPLLDAVAFPNGRANDVNQFVKAYLDEHPAVQGLFCSGGVNLRATRTEWFRMFAGDGSIRHLISRIYEEIRATR
jgi:hypothetical protein